MSKSHYASDDEESARILSSSAPLSVLLIPSLKEVKPYVYLILIISNCMLEQTCVVPSSRSKLACYAK